ncbi:hypothetical protein ACQP2F_22980 [Actinoplanes sp. CA-030573]|uniref:hypothetical protein n=1 Tax=Actinoplanes sp. CA-030573 TaxID=3239898 RepID=UPI003D8DB8C9
MSDDNGAPAARWGWQFWVATGLLIGFAVLVVAMIWLAGGDDVVWQRRLYVFGAVEAIVFTAVGWLFGREVNRSAVDSARADATEAREAAAAQTAEATEERVAATEANTRLDAVRAAVQVGTTPAQTGPQDVSARPRADAAADLRALIEAIAGPPRPR